MHINVTDDERANAASANVPGVTISNKHLPTSPIVPVFSVSKGNVYQKIPDFDANTIFLPLISR